MNTENNTDIKEQLKFYADTPKGEKNKLFCFEVNILELENAVKRFLIKGFNIRAAWYQKTNIITGEIKENTRLNIENIQNSLIDKYVKSKNPNNLP